MHKCDDAVRVCICVCLFVCVWVCVHRDNEQAYVSVNGNTCWTRTGISGEVGTQECGTETVKEESFHVIGCYISLSNSQTNTLRVKVWADLDHRWSDES